MRAAIVREFGPIPSHSVGELPDPNPGRGQVLVKIKAVAVNYVDSLVVTGKYQFLPVRPFAPGKLPVGEVSGLGPGVRDRFTDGALVVAALNTVRIEGSHSVIPMVIQHLGVSDKSECSDTVAFQKYNS